MSKLQELTDLFTSMEEARLEFETQLTAKGKEVVEELMNAVGDRYPGFIVYGYTPTFNDGDPCEHYGEQLDLEDADDYGLGDYVEDYDWDNIPKGTILPHEQKQIDTVIGMFERYAETKYGTNYVIVVYKDQETGEVVFVDSDYDCGY